MSAANKTGSRGRFFCTLHVLCDVSRSGALSLLTSLLWRELVIIDEASHSGDMAGYGQIWRDTSRYRRKRIVRTKAAVELELVPSRA